MDASAPERRHTLLSLLHDSLDKGHWRVALRRFLMLRSLGLSIPAELATVCEHFMGRCGDRELARMHQSALDLAAMLRPVRDVDSPARQAVDKYDYLHAISRPRSR